MFDFERLQVYQKSKAFNLEVSTLLKAQAQLIDRSVQNQLRSAALSIMLNIAEGTGRSTKADKKNFYIIARGSVFECVALADVLSMERILQKGPYEDWYKQLEEISKMLFAMIKSIP
jgi:four helix bundle protein